MRSFSGHNMARGRFTALFLFMALALILSACTPAEASMTVQIAYVRNGSQAPDAAALETESRKIPVSEGLMLYRRLLQEMLKAPGSDALYSVFPKGMRLLGVAFDDGLVHVDLSGEFTGLSDAKQTLGAACILTTLSQRSEVEGLVLSVEGQSLYQEPLRPGAYVSSLDALRIVSYVLTLYFPDPAAKNFYIVQRQVQLTADQEPARLILEELMAGCQIDSGETIRFLPENVKLHNVSVRYGVCTVDFSAEFLDVNIFDENGESLTIYAIVNSLTSLSNVQSVQFLIDGLIVSSPIHPHFDQPISPARPAE